MPAGLLPDVQEQLPVPVDGVHAVMLEGAGVAGTDGVSEVIVCAADAASLSGVARDMLHVGPTELPEFLSEKGVSAADFNLLVGPFEPAPITRRRFQRHLLRVACVVVVAGLCAFGLARRAEYAKAYGQAFRDAHAQLIDEVGLPRDARAMAERVELARRVHAAAKRIVPPVPADVALADVLKSWPARVPSSPQSIRVTAGEISAAVVLEGEATPFLTALQASVPEGWRLEEPRLNAVGGVFRVSLRYLRVETPDAAGGGRR